ncbi:hypothetical protein [Nocardioides zhouii]|uniref:DUF998 domain-containing protein n=1 Tax=Nocardioides zhouii TaxID=1168729 RepID=A0A4Q2SE39_9ACTN|nr:hypothetical protein [Nocardioides zhouii]RYC03322.1 hypothetical protein EUA94_21885 [Nocardioides zhouii]
MAILKYDEREYKATYFALRVGLIFSSVLVLLAPLSVRMFDGSAPPSISDSWYTDARMIFVLGLAAAGSLLIVVRGDTQSEQTLLNVAGGLGLIVAGAACWPKDDNGKSLEKYDPDVARLNMYAIGALLVVLLAVWILGTVIQRVLVKPRWNTRDPYKWILNAIAPLLLVGGLIGFLRFRTPLAEHAHGPAAVSLFVLLGCVALLRTGPGVRFLNGIEDTPVDNSLTAMRNFDGETGKRAGKFDRVYTLVAIGMFVVVAAAAALGKSDVRPLLILIMEALLLVLFVLFWSTQTIEAWVSDKTPTDDDDPEGG